MTLARQINSLDELIANAAAGHELFRGPNGFVSARGAHNVMAYGAVGDGVTDDTAAFQTAINAARNGALFIPQPASTYRITDTLTIEPSSGPQVRMRVIAQGVYYQITFEGTNKPCFKAYGLKDCRFEGIKIRLDAHGAVGWDIEADAIRTSTSQVLWDTCFVETREKYGCVGWRGNKSGGNRDLSALVWINCAATGGSANTFGFCGWQNLTQNGLIWSWYGTQAYYNTARFANIRGFGYLNGAINSAVTTLTLDDCRHLPYAGTVTIGTEDIAFTSRNATQLLGCARGANATTPASHSDGAYAPEQVPAGESAIGGASMNFYADNCSHNKTDFMLGNAGAYLISGGRFEVGELFLRAGIGGSTSTYNVTVDTAEISYYSGVGGVLFDLNSSTNLSIDKTWIRQNNLGANWTAAMIDGGGAGATGYGSVMGRGGFWNAADPCYQSLQANWRTDLHNVVRGSADLVAAAWFA